MKLVKDQKLFGLFREYFTEYLPKQRRYSRHTVRNYQSGIDSYLDYLKTVNNIKIQDITFSMINRQSVKDFLQWLEDERGVSVATRNHRLSCINSFLAFASDIDSKLTITAAEIGKIKAAKDSKTTVVPYLSEKAVKAILAAPDGSTTLGMRDRVMLILLYDTGARIQEILDIKLKDLQFSDSPIVTVTGKGGKTRNVNLMQNTVKHLKKYISVFHPDKAMYDDDYLFYTVHIDGNKRMTEDNARKRVKEYGEIARKQCKEIPEDVHPHLFRHSRAMHLYQQGMPLPLISKWLGHSEVETTQIYATADTEMKRKAIEAATPPDSPLRQHVNANRYTINDEDTIKKLYGLK